LDDLIRSQEQRWRDKRLSLIRFLFRLSRFIGVTAAATSCSVGSSRDSEAIADQET